jgi:crotonobetainyl-CoA:carnitine CoA-transferase CaiB-like acyl-CoA transferase
MRVADGDACGPLANVKVLDLSRFIAGPFCGQILGDMGADVIKVERPGGEDARKVAPSYEGESLYVMTYNRNKRGITLSTRHPRALGILEGLVQRSDVLVENYRPGTLEAMGLAPERLLELNPRLVITRLSGFGQTGPFSARALFDAIAQAMSGLMSLTGEPDGGPVLAGTYIADFVAALYGAIGTLLALYAREQTGKGQVVDVASLDGLVTCLGTQPAAMEMLGLQPSRRGNRDGLNAPATVFRARDRYVYMHAGTNGLFARICTTMGRPDLINDPRFADVPNRVANTAEIEEIVGEWIANYTADELGELLTEVGIPFGPVATISDLVTSPQLRARDMFVDVEHPELGTLKLLGSPIKLSDTPASMRLAPPMVGADNEAVYRGFLGLSAEDLAELEREGVV